MRRIRKRRGPRCRRGRRMSWRAAQSRRRSTRGWTRPRRGPRGRGRGRARERRDPGGRQAAAAASGGYERTKPSPSPSPSRADVCSRIVSGMAMEGSRLSSAGSVSPVVKVWCIEESEVQRSPSSLSSVPGPQ